MCQNYSFMRFISLLILILVGFSAADVNGAVSMSATMYDTGVGLMRAAGPTNANSLLSPASIELALAMTFAGAKGITHTQMKENLFGGSANDVIHEEFSKLTDLLNPKNASYQLRTVNRVYSQIGYNILDEFKAILAERYKTKLYEVDFGTAAEQIRSRINNFVSNTTNNKINNLIPAGALDALTRLVLINAIYFKGEWSSKFDAKKTKAMPFHSSENEINELQMMNCEMKAKYSENDDVQILELPYGVRKELTFMVVLPKKRFNLDSIEQKMAGSQLIGILEQSWPRKIKVSLPKFRLEKSFKLKNALKSLGVTEMFNGDSADFSGISQSKDLHVSSVIHKSFIEVNEEGAEAAAASAVIMTYKSAAMPIPTPVFKADHPFLFAILHNEHHQPLFIGRFTNQN